MTEMGVIAQVVWGSHRNWSFVQCDGYQVFWRNILPLIFKGHLNTKAVCSPIPRMTYSFHSFGMCRMQQFLAVLRSFFHSCLLCTFSCHPSPPTIRPSSLPSSCYLFLGLPLNLVFPKFIYNTPLGILFSSILFTWPNQHNLFNLLYDIYNL